VELGLVREQQEVDDDARRVEAERPFDGGVDHPAEELSRRRAAVEVRDVGAEDESGFFWTGQILEKRSLAR
jgi:hypothetical protein